MPDLYLQYGCGWQAPSGWLNFDASPTLRFERLPLLGRLWTRNQERFPSNARWGDIVRGLPLANGRCKAVYCSHVLEHLALADMRIALRNTWELLAPGGRFRLVVPDLAREIDCYRADRSPHAASNFMRQTSLGWEQRERGIRGLLVDWLGNSRHLWMWDYPALNAELADAGFIDIRRAEFGDSEDPRFAEAEREDRWLNALGIECRRPPA